VSAEHEIGFENMPPNAAGGGVVEDKDDIEPWRAQFNKDIIAEAAKHPEIELIITDGEDKTEKQVADVENLIRQEVDALLISPKESAGLTGVVTQAIDAKIPVFVLDRNVETDKYAQFIGGDNTVIGKAASAGLLDKLKITLALTSETQGGLTSANGVATIPGRSAKRIIVNAHADGFFQGGDDNASGLAVLVGLARYFAKQPQPAHTLMFVASGGHHGPGNGPTSLVAAHPELKDGTVLILNLEHVAYADIVRGKVRAPDNIGMTWETSVTEAAKAVGVTNESPFLFDLWKRASRCYGVATYQSAGTTVSGDLGGYRPLNVPMTQMIQSGTFYHASGDVLEAVPAEGLERAARFHAFFLEQADQAPESLIAAGKGTPYQPIAKACP